MRIAVLAIVFATSFGVSAADLVNAVPKHFQGEWNAVLADCGTGDNDSALRIDRNHIYFYESDGPIKAVVIHGAYEIAMISELSGEGQTWLATHEFTLSPGKDRLTSTSIPGENFVRYKCPSKP